MPVLFRYLVSAFLMGAMKIFGVFIGLFFLLDGAEQIRRFSDAPEGDLGNIALLLALRMPDFLAQFLPPIVLLATLITLTRLSQQNEITVMRAGGVSIQRILLPFLAGGLLIAALQMAAQDQIAPRTNQAARSLANQMEGLEPLTSASGGEPDFWLRDGSRIIHADRASIPNQALLGVTVFQFDERHQLIRRQDARKAEFRDGQWFLIDGMAYDFRLQAGAERFERRPWEAGLASDQLNRNAPQPESLPITQLWAFAERLEREGYDATHYWVLFHRKVADPFTTLSAILLAFPFALRQRQRQGGATRMVAVGILAGFCMFVAVDLITALGLGGRLPPVAAGWGPVLFFASLGAYFLARIEGRSPD